MKIIVTEKELNKIKEGIPTIELIVKELEHPDTIKINFDLSDDEYPWGTTKFNDDKSFEIEVDEDLLVKIIEIYNSTTHKYIPVVYAIKTLFGALMTWSGNIAEEIEEYKKFVERRYNYAATTVTVNFGEEIRCNVVIRCKKSNNKYIDIKYLNFNASSDLEIDFQSKMIRNYVLKHIGEADVKMFDTVEKAIKSFEKK